jgi:hypothetical protein
VFGRARLQHEPRAKYSGVQLVAGVLTRFDGILNRLESSIGLAEPSQSKRDEGRRPFDVRLRELQSEAPDILREQVE